MNTTHLITALYQTKGWNLYKSTVDKSGQIVSQVYKKQVVEGNKVATMTKTISGETSKMSTTFTNATNKSNDLIKALRRAAIVAPIWLALRAIMMKVLNSIKDIINTYKELDMGMRKVMAVATDTGQGQAKIYADLEQRARNYFASTSRSIKEVTESMYQLGTAGRSTEEIMEGFEHVMNLAIGTFGDVTTSGRVVAGILNVFETSLKRAGGTSEQLRYISDLLASAWKNNQIELSELNTAMGYLASVGSALNMSLQELVASSSVMSDALLRGGKGGRLLARSFVEIVKDSKKLRDLGVIFDPYKPLNFYNVMKQLHELYIKSAGSMGFVNDLVDIFGVRGVRAVLSVLQQWEKFNKEMNRSPEEIKGVAEELKNLAESSYWALMRKQWHQMITGMEAGTGISALKEAWAESLIEGDKVRKQINMISSNIKLLGNEIALTKKEAAALWQTLIEMGANKTADKLREAIDFPFDLVFDIEFGKGEETLNRIIKQMEVIEGMGLTKHIEIAETEKFKPSTIAMDELMSRYGTYTKNIITNTTEANKFMADLVDKGKSFTDITENEWQQLSKITGFEKDRLPILKRVIELRLEELKVSNEVEVSSSALGRLEKEKLQLLQQSIGYEILKVKGYSETSILMKQITNEVNKQNKIIEEYNKKNITDQKELITIGDILSQNVEKLKASAIERVDIEEMLKLSKQTAIAIAKEEHNTVETLIKHELNLLKLRGATDKQILESTISMNNQLGIEQDALSLLKNKLALEIAIKKEKEAQTNLSSETMKLYEISQKEGLMAAKQIGEFLQGRMTYQALQTREVFGIFKEYFPQIEETMKALQFFKRGIGRGIPIEEEAVRQQSWQRPEWGIKGRVARELPEAAKIAPKVDINTQIAQIEVTLPEGSLENMAEHVGNTVKEYLLTNEKYQKDLMNKLRKYA